MKNYDPKEPSRFITYLDMNNLYGWTMSGYLPYGGFKWLKNVDGFDVNSISEKSSIRYVLEVDLEYPDELHVLHNDYPLAPEKLATRYDILSDYSKKIAEEYGIKVSDLKKLIPGLGNKTNYVLHYRSLQLHLSLGMKLTKIHRVLKFKQSDWMRKYIDFNTKIRTNAANIFEKDFFKLRINSVYGKTMENLPKRINVRLVNNKKDFLKYTSRPTHLTHIIFSNYPKDSKLFDETNKKVIGKMKDESEEKIINEFVGLKSKMYSMKKIVGKESNTAKEVNIATEFNEFKNILGTYEISKSISLSVFDDKRLF